MPRGPRLDTPGALHHVVARGIERRVIFRDDSDRTDFLQRVGDAAFRTQATVLAWALLPNHFHLLVRSGSGGLSTMMRCLLSGYVSRFNRRHRRCGRLFQNRFKSILVEQEAYLVELVRYIHLNPVRAGRVADVDALRTHRWSGHGCVMGEPGPAWQAVEEVLGWFGGAPPGARVAYERFVQAGWHQGRREDLSGGGLKRSRWGRRFAVGELERGRERGAYDERILGGAAFVRQVLAALEAEQDVRARLPRARIDRQHVRAVALVRAAQAVGLEPDTLRRRSRRRDVVAGRALVSYVLVEGAGLTLQEVALELGAAPSTVMRAVGRGRELALKLRIGAADLLE